MTSVIRVLHVVTYMGRGGLETMLMNYYRNIDRSKIQFDFLVHRDFIADYDNEILALGGKIFRLPKLNPFSRNYKDKVKAFFVEHNEYTIVHCHLDCMAGIPLQYAKENGAHICIAHAHNSNQTKDIKYILKLIYKRIIPKNADLLFACGYESGKWMFRGNEFYILNNAIDVNQYSYNCKVRNQIRSDLGFDENNYVIGHVGRFSPQKNHSFIIDVFRVICELNDSARLLLIGAGELMNSIKQRVDKYGLSDKVIFTGLRPNVSDYLQAMDVFFFPSLNEGLPLSIIEAQTSGLPCIVSERVPSDCIKTDLVNQVNLDESVDEWAHVILNSTYNKRIDHSETIRNAGFDVTRNAYKLECFYETCEKQRENVLEIKKIANELFDKMPSERI